jgi:peroxiredoxin Q/BCP
MAKKTSGLSSMVGSKVPYFEAPSTTGSAFSPKTVAGQNWVLYFYPRDATPGCTIEGQDFSKLYPKFKKNGAEVVGISRDTLKSHAKFREKMGFPFELISDEDEGICKAFDVIKMKNMYGRKVRGIERSTFVVDSKGVIRREWRGVRVPGHAEEVLEFIKTLKA